MSSRGQLVAAALMVLGVAGSFGLAINFTAKRFAHDHLPTGPDVVHVEVVARQFAWEVRHPGADGVLGTTDDLTLTNELRVPVGRDVVVHLKSRDVVHALYLPAYGVYRDVIPGREALFSFRATAMGESTMLCAQLCGVGHAQMQGRATAMPEAEWRRWNGGRSIHISIVHDAVARVAPGFGVPPWRRLLRLNPGY